MIRRIQTEMGIITVFVTHDQEEAVVLADRIALLFHDRLQQFDVPDAFFETPGSIPIAKFFGGTNFIPGRYEDGAMTTSIGRFRAPHSSVAYGEAVLSIRPEALDLGVGGDNSVMGTVRSHVYVGRYARFRLTIGDAEIEVTTDPGQVKEFNEGDEISVRFDPAKIWVIGAPSADHQDGG